MSPTTEDSARGSTTFWQWPCRDEADTPAICESVALCLACATWPRTSTDQNHLMHTCFGVELRGEHMHMHVHMCMTSRSTYAGTYTCACRCPCICARARAHVQVQVHMHVRVHVHGCACTCVGACVSARACACWCMCTQPMCTSAVHMKWRSIACRPACELRAPRP